MSTTNRNFQPVKYAANRHSVTGVLAVAALAGMVLSRKAGETDVLELANGKAGFFLDRDVVSAADFKTATEQHQLYPNKAGFVYPYMIGGAVTAEDFEEIWIEGDALHSSMDSSVTADTGVTTNAGKVCKLTDMLTQEALGIVRQNIPAINGAGRRFLIEIRRSVKVITH